MFKSTFKCQIYDQFSFKLFLGTMEEINIQCEKDRYGPLSETGIAKFAADINEGSFYFVTDFLLEPWIISHECNHCAMWMFEQMDQNILYHDHTYIYLHDWLVKVVTMKFRKHFEKEKSIKPNHIIIYVV